MLSSLPVPAIRHAEALAARKLSLLNALVLRVSGNGTLNGNARSGTSYATIHCVVSVGLNVAAECAVGLPSKRVAVVVGKRVEGVRAVVAVSAILGNNSKLKLNAVLYAELILAAGKIRKPVAPLVDVDKSVLTAVVELMLEQLNAVLANKALVRDVVVLKSAAEVLVAVLLAKLLNKYAELLGADVAVLTVSVLVHDAVEDSFGEVSHLLYPLPAGVCST